MSLFPHLEPCLSLPTLLIIPSGIGCSIGGYAGDAIPAARLLAAASGLLITHPNVLNGASLYWPDSRFQYVEGFGIDKFASGAIGLKPVLKRKVGLLLDAQIESDLRQRHLEVANACRASLGLDIGPVITTDIGLDVNVEVASSGSSWGGVRNPDALLSAGERLRDAGASAIAVVTRFPDDLAKQKIDDYRKGKGVDVVAGAEAVISHLLVSHLGIPCAHAPALKPLEIEESLDPRAAAEELGHTFLPCVLVGLSRAPDMIPLDPDHLTQVHYSGEVLTVHNLGAVVAPNGALGGEAVLACIEKGIPLIAVSNPGVSRVDAQNLGIISNTRNSNFFSASNYVEAAGLILALREGINGESLYRPLSQLLEYS